MNRRDPERIYASHRAGIFRRLVDEQRVNELDAEHWIATWEPEAATTGVKAHGHGFWNAGWRWIESQRNAQKTDMGAQGDDGQVFGG